MSFIAIGSECNYLKPGISWSTPVLLKDKNIYNPITQFFESKKQLDKLVNEDYISLYPYHENKGRLTVNVNYEMIPKCYSVIWYGYHANLIRNIFLKFNKSLLGTTECYINYDNYIKNKYHYLKYDQDIKPQNKLICNDVKNDILYIDIIGQKIFKETSENVCDYYFELITDSINRINVDMLIIIQQLLVLSCRNPKINALETYLSDDYDYKYKFTCSLLEYYPDLLEEYNSILDKLKTINVII